jgi:RHS repeat-associated protein
VKSTINGNTTTYFVGAHYEVSGSTVTKYYYAGSQRIAMRSNGTLNYLLGDHLGSTSLTTDAAGNKGSEVRYKAWGEVRYAWGNVSTKYQYTGQFSYEQEFGLYFYNARWYDSALGRFAQADTIIPQTQGVQAWDRYTYANNNPLRYIDPTGHMMAYHEGGGGDGGCGLECFKMLRAKEKSKWAAKQLRAEMNRCPTFASCYRGFAGVFPAFTNRSVPNLTLSEPDSQTNSSQDIDTLLFYWKKIVSPFNDGLDLYDAYRLSSSGGWRYARTALNLTLLEGVVAGSGQLYRDSWVVEKSFIERGSRALLAGVEASATDLLSDKIGDGGRTVGALVGGRQGAVAGKLIGNTLGTQIGDIFSSNIVNPLISQYTPLGPVFP